MLWTDHYKNVVSITYRLCLKETEHGQVSDYIRSSGLKRYGSTLTQKLRGITGCGQVEHLEGGDILLTIDTHYNTSPLWEEIGEVIDKYFEKARKLL